MNAADIMTRPVISATPETSIEEAARLMLDHRISGLPVVEAGSVVGMLTEGDLLRRAETGTERRYARWVEFLISPGRLARDYTNANARKVGEVMSPAVVTVAPEDSIAQIVSQMERHRIKRVPVVDNGKLVGIVSRANLVRALIRTLSNATPQGQMSDEEIRDRIVAEISRQPWGPRASVTVRVNDGAVELNGAITDERERTALQVLAESTPGVKSVRDQLVWVEPLSGFVISADAVETSAKNG